MYEEATPTCPWCQEVISDEKFKGAVWGLSAQRDRASAERDVTSVLFDVTMQNLHGKKLTFSLSERKNTFLSLFF